MPFVEVYESATGRKTRVPEHWLTHPVLSRGIRKTPLTRKADADKADQTPPAIEQGAKGQTNRKPARKAATRKDDA